VTLDLPTLAVILAGLDDQCRYPDIKRVAIGPKTRCTGSPEALNQLVTELNDRATEGADGFAHSGRDKKVFRRAVVSARRQGVEPRE